MEISYHIDLTVDAWAALIRHGYDPTRPARGVPGPPGDIESGLQWGVGGRSVRIPLRNHVCRLDGVEVDGHHSSDLDPCGPCIYCDCQSPYGFGLADL